jgi:hypothetical protein
VAGASNARRKVIERGRCGGFFVELLIGDEQFEVAAGLAHVHLEFLAVHEKFAEIAEKEPPAPASLVKISLAREGERSIAADTVEVLLIGDALSLGLPRGGSVRPFLTSRSCAPRMKTVALPVQDGPSDDRDGPRRDGGHVDEALSEVARKQRVDQGVGAPPVED